MARYPNSPNMLVAEGGSGIGEIEEVAPSTLTQATDYWKGATVRFRSIDWTWEYAQVTSFSNKIANFSTDVRYAMKGGYQFFFENKREQLDAKNEWFYDTAAHQLLYYPTIAATIQTSNVKAVLFDTGITLDSLVSYVHVSNLLFDKYADCGFVAKGRNAFVKVENCSFQNIERIGIKFFLKSSNSLVDKCFLKDIRGRGISFTESSHNVISNNVVRRIGLVPGRGTTGVNGCEGITVELYDETRNKKFDRYDSIANHNIVHHNIIDSTGYISLRIDGQYNTVEKNIIENSMLHLSDGGELYCFNKLTKSSRLYNNFIINSPNPCTGIYVDNNVTDFDIQNNTVTNIAGTGITINAEAHENKVSNNVIFGNSSGIGFYDWAANPIFGNKITKNTIVSLYSGSPAVVIASNTNRYDVAAFDSNYYVNPYTDQIFKFQWSISKTYNLATWRNYFPANDLHSIALTNKAPIAAVGSIFLFTNKTDTLRKVNLTGCTCADLDNNPVTELILNPFTSKVLKKTDLTKCKGLVTDPPHITPANNWPLRTYDSNSFANDSVFGIVAGISSTSLEDDCFIFPVPAKSGAKIFFKNLKMNENSIVVEIKDILGKTIYLNSNVLNNEIQLPAATPGIYFLTIENGKEHIGKKICIE